MEHQITLVLPCYKPEPGWTEKVLSYYLTVLPKLPGIEWFVVIVNDGTPAMVAEEDVQKLKRLIHNFSYYSYNGNKGKGYALRYGVERAVTSAIIYTDLDFPYTTDSLLEVANLLNTYDAVIGIKNDSYYSNVPALRKRISKLLQGMIVLFFPAILTTDTQCGLKGFKGKAKDVFLQTRINNYLFDLEFIARVSRQTKLPVILKEIQLGENVRFVPVSPLTIIRELLSFFRIAFAQRLFPKK